MNSQSAFGRTDVSALERFLQTLPILQWKLRIDRNPARRPVNDRPRRADRELDALTTLRMRLHVLRVLRGREEIGQQRLELDLAPAAARLDVCQHALQIADADSERLHFAEPSMHLLQAIRHDLERCTQPLFERRLQFFVDGRAHLVELLPAFIAQAVELLFDGPREIRQAIADFLS